MRTALEAPKFLYHGTGESFLPGILRDGIKPRGRGKAQWEGSGASRPDCIYLTTAYPFFYAIHSVKDEERLCVVEIDISRLLERGLLPDEDFMAQREAVLTHTSWSPELQERHKRVLWKNHQYWPMSIVGLGTCAYKGVVPPVALGRVCLVDHKKRMQLLMSTMDPTITLTNYHVLGAYYRGMVAWLFGDRPDLPEMWGHQQPVKVEGGSKWMDEMDAKRKEYLEKEGADRSGIEVRVLGEGGKT